MISANEIADELGMPRPTEQQRLVIEAPLTPALVVAGAGSGKTETMANRVLYLLANGEIKAAEILGLTFTRKAAGELATRVRERISQLGERGLVSGDHDIFDTPTVATYNSFANTIYRDNAALIGRESDGTVLGEASAWQIARSIVVSSTDSRLGDLGKRVDDVTKAVLALSHSISENLVDVESVRSMAARFASITELPPGGRGEYAEIAGLASTVGSLDVLLDLAAGFSAAKARRGFVEYSDQVALALEILRTSPKISAELRTRYRVVLLDEYQDTSVVQTWLLAELFARHPVMAVGDPHQSIYGWRGASAANLEQFASQFGDGTVNEFTLSTTWRNGHGILAVANRIVEPLVAVARIPVGRLGAGPAASSLPVEVLFEETVLEEAEVAALWLKAQLAVRDGKGEPPTAAMLFRARKTQPYFIEALRKHGVPFHVLGISGLMAEPEIADIVSALAVLSDPGAGSELLRLLAGSRWRIGVRDLRALSRLASWLRDRDYAQQVLADDVREQLRASVAEGEGGSIVDALDFLATASESHTAFERFSAIGAERLREAGRLFARLRARSSLDLVDFVTVVEQELQLDIEVIANESRALGNANMEAFFDALSGYLAVDETSSLRGFLAWLREAEFREGLSPRPEDAEAGTVQLLTIHGAKGLEWDVVVVPRLVESELPATSNEGYTGWLSFGSLPWQFRGDSAELPVFAWESAETRKELKDARGAFVEQVRARHVDEERRLAYVAVTRARHSLLLTGSFWATQTASRPPSTFLRELEADGLIGALPERSDFDENPLGDTVNLFSWPMDPLGSRRDRVQAAAAAVRAAAIAGAEPAGPDSWHDELELLLAERDAQRVGNTLVALPTRVPASRFKDFVSDPAAVASALRRPMPQKPYRATRLGTLFHSWVEERVGVAGASEEIDRISTESDDESEFDDDAQLDRLKSTFEKSEWAERLPIDVEIEIHVVLSGQIIVCKLDAVYFDGERYQIVDWKTGKSPKDAADLEQKQLQLALYRLAYSQWKGIDASLIDAVFYFVADDTVIRPERIFDEAELEALWKKVS